MAQEEPTTKQTTERDPLKLAAMAQILESAGWLVRAPDELWFTPGFLGGVSIMFGDRHIGTIQAPTIGYTDSDSTEHPGYPFWHVLSDWPDGGLGGPANRGDFTTEAEARKAIVKALENPEP